VSTGRKGHLTPTGNFHPTRMAAVYFSRKYDDAPMPHAIFFLGGFAIHGTEYVSSLGRRASHGCVRLHPANAALLYSLVQQYGAAHTAIRIRG
jgi:lipoprotein-anchoring transpeptidase ErfK/SrfK